MATVKIVHWQDGGVWRGYLAEHPEYQTQGDTLDDLKGHLLDLYRDLSATAQKGEPDESTPNRLTPESALAKLAAAGGPEYVTLFRHGSLAVEVYRPVTVDRQKPHTRDEVYVVIAGTGFFVIGGGRRPFGPGEVLFAPAGSEHRFEDFTADFATWVFFYGPEGGEG
jgi:mannose-6-phosphate isomerase-like protein (cupin superfamily)